MTKGKGREGKGREGKGREGKGREGKGGEEGREGKGREGKGRKDGWTDTDREMDKSTDRQTNRQIEISYHSAKRAGLLSTVATTLQPWAGELDHVVLTTIIICDRTFNTLSGSFVTNTRLPTRSSEGTQCHRNDVPCKLLPILPSIEILN